MWLEGEDRAELQAIARTAKHRLQRGIWTSPGAGWCNVCLSASGLATARDHRDVAQNLVQKCAIFSCRTLVDWEKIPGKAVCAQGGADGPEVLTGVSCIEQAILEGRSRQPRDCA